MKKTQKLKEKEKSRSLIDAIKNRIKYLEDHDPDNVNLEQLKHHVSEYVSEESKY